MHAITVSWMQSSSRLINIHKFYISLIIQIIIINNILSYHNIVMILHVFEGLYLYTVVCEVQMLEPWKIWGDALHYYFYTARQCFTNPTTFSNRTSMHIEALTAIFFFFVDNM